MFNLVLVVFLQFYAVPLIGTNCQEELKLPSAIKVILLSFDHESSKPRAP